MYRLFFVIVATICYATLSASHSAAAPAGHGTAQPVAPVQQVIALPSAQPIHLVASQKPPKTAPTGTVLTIDAIGLQTTIVPVGVTASNEIDVPATSQAGRWIGSADFGVPGTTFLDGHVYGVFAHLQRVQPGQIVSVTTHGQTYTYKIEQTETLALADIAMGQLLHTYDSSEGLVIMTCAGDYLPAMGTYDKRFVVYAQRVS